MQFTSTLGIQAMSALASHLGFPLPLAPQVWKDSYSGLEAESYICRFHLASSRYVEVSSAQVARLVSASEPCEPFKQVNLTLMEGITSNSGIGFRYSPVCSLAFKICSDSLGWNFGVAKHFHTGDSEFELSYIFTAGPKDKLVLSLRERRHKNDHFLTSVLVSCDPKDPESTMRGLLFFFSPENPLVPSRTSPVPVSVSQGSSLWNILLSDLGPFHCLGLPSTPAEIRLFAPVRNVSFDFSETFLDPVKTFEWGARLSLRAWARTRDNARTLADFGLEAFRI